MIAYHHQRSHFCCRWFCFEMDGLKSAEKEMADTDAAVRETYMAHYGDFQHEIYFGGLKGVRPKLPVDTKTLEARAEAAMSPDLLSYIQGGCGDEFTQDRNVTAFHDWGIIPRMLVDCTKRDLSVDLFGRANLAPSAMVHRGAHHSG